jgi:hypothetical protein
VPEQVSRQMAYQRTKIAAGLCARCGHRPLATATHCAGCAEKHRRRMREKMRRRRGTRPWQKGKRGRPPLDRGEAT